MACVSYSRNIYSKIILRSFTMSSQMRAKAVVEELKLKNPYFEKYADKIAALQNTSPDEFMDRVNKISKKTTVKESKRSYSELLNPKQQLNDLNGRKEPKLEDIMKLELIKHKTVEEIKTLWIEYHKTRDVIAATITSEQFEELKARGQEYPIFLLPLPRSEGYEFIMLQFSGNSVHFTPLLCYQVHKENAPECLNIVHFTELKDKGVVLMRGEFDSKVINAQEAQCLANQLQMYYFKTDEAKLAILKTFNRSPDSFKHMDLVNQLETINLK